MTVTHGLPLPALFAPDPPAAKGAACAEELQGRVAAVKMRGYHCDDKYIDAIFPAYREPGFAVRTIAGVCRLMRTALEQQG